MKKRLMPLFVAVMFIIPVLTFGVGKIATVKDIGKVKNGVGGKPVKLDHIKHKKFKNCKQCHDLTRKKPDKNKVHTYCKNCHNAKGGPKECKGCHK